VDFVWNDGGRAACGFVGLAGDCVTRSIAIATGTVYRDVYNALGTACEKSARNGVSAEVAASYLEARNWKRVAGGKHAFEVEKLPKGIVIVHVAKSNSRSQHFSTVIDHVVHDTWNPADDDYMLLSYWSGAGVPNKAGPLVIGAPFRSSGKQEVTQAEFDKILHRLRALDRTASNSATTDGERHNALRMMQALLLRHNLTRDDIVDGDNVENVQFTRIACPVNGLRACNWESMLATYVTSCVFTTTFWYSSRKGHRTLFWFCGPVSDVKNAIALFREILLTIAAAAYLRFGGHTRGSGASYAEGYVEGLPRFASNPESDSVENSSGDCQLIQTRTLAMHHATIEWLEFECDIRLQHKSRYGRHQHDASAAMRGKIDGSKHSITVPNTPRRITHQ
jgi:Protein of unknown function (DUF2786)